MSRTNKFRVVLYSGAVLLTALLFLTGCGTFEGIGRDINDAARGLRAAMTEE